MVTLKRSPFLYLLHQISLRSLHISALISGFSLNRSLLQKLFSGRSSYFHSFFSSIACICSNIFENFAIEIDFVCGFEVDIRLGCVCVWLMLKFSLPGWILAAFTVRGWYLCDLWFSISDLWVCNCWCVFLFQFLCNFVFLWFDLKNESFFCFGLLKIVLYGFENVSSWFYARMCSLSCWNSIFVEMFFATFVVSSWYAFDLRLCILD